MLGLPAFQALKLLTPVDADGRTPIPDPHPEVLAMVPTILIAPDQVSVQH